VHAGLAPAPHSFLRIQQMRLLHQETSIAEKVQIAIRSTSSNAIPFRVAVGARSWLFKDFEPTMAR
jgi:hypothetical protein